MNTNKWMYGTSAMTAAGVSTDTGVADSTGATGGSQTKNYTVSSDGIVTSTVQGSDFHAVMSSDKNLIVGTVSNSGSYLLLIWVKGGTTFTQADLTGNWVFHGLRASDGQNMWLYGNSTFDSTGKLTFTSSMRSYGTTTLIDSGTGVHTVSSSGIVTSITNSRFHAVVTPSKDMMVMTTDSGNGQLPALWIGLKR